MKYETAAALRRAIEDRLRDRSARRGIARSRKVIVFERFLARLMVDSPNRWVLKGALALDFRTSAGSRTTMDMDLARHGDDDAVVEDLLSAAALDLQDFFVFRVERVENREFGETLRFRVEAELAGRPFDTILVDVGLSDSAVWPSEEVSTPGSLNFAGIPPISIPVLAIEQHVAEKVHAYTRLYGRDQRSSRIKDLVDLLVIGELSVLDATRLRTALQAVFEERRSHQVPTHLPEPPDSWRRGLSRIMNEMGRKETLEDVHALVSRFLDPVLGSSLEGRWDSLEWSWEEGSAG